MWKDYKIQSEECIYIFFSICILGGFESEYFLGFSHKLSLQCTFPMEVQSLHTSIKFMNVNINFQVQCLLASLACKTCGVANFWRTIGGASWLWMDMALSPAQSSRLLRKLSMPWHLCLVCNHCLLALLSSYGTNLTV